MFLLGPTHEKSLDVGKMTHQKKYCFIFNDINGRIPISTKLAVGQI